MGIINFVTAVCFVVLTAEVLYVVISFIVKKQSR